MTSITLRRVDARAAYLGVACVNAIAFAIVVMHRWLTPLPGSEYVHRLVTYEGGLLRRALVGDIYARFTDQVAPWVVRVEGMVAVAVCFGLAMLLFRRCIRGRQADVFALGCLIFGSPLLFKNFIGNLGKFDVLGAIVAMLAILLPLRLATVVLVGLASAALLLVHHIHATIYVPTIYGILLLRMVAQPGGLALRDGALLAASLAVLASLFLYLLFAAVPKVPVEVFLDHIRARAVQHVGDEQSFMWYASLADELPRTFAVLPGHLARLPVYAAIILIHWPVIAFFARRQQRVQAEHPGLGPAWLVVCVVVLGGFLVTNVITFDYARHLGNLAMCFLLLALAQIAAHGGRGEDDSSDIDATNPKVVAAALATAALPWVGVVYPLI
ncbi:hypothetical protein [Phreatobacter cathodiphilus]|uniref:Glycosyltransferase RgtA/B/C/D-like domain-containing protein n=1 Tax=Phreatobacter cathodiphilus TaxID=1868589 RepID=A0A2S0ND56_9HYPH|nr:hypothetical protein [Phreatobacter cathodiphilus]AVO46100.1 hypothetical protein C6569_14030 [Phreatobacter cathodiphilus]